MQLTYTYDGEPEVALVVDIPKMREKEIEPKVVWKTRLDLYTMMMGISQESRANPQAYATQLFKTIKSQYQSLVLVAVVFTIKHEKGRSVLTYTEKDVPRL
jgi:hypothetical protein